MTDALLQFAGRLHPMVLHLPIGLAVGLLILESVALFRKRPLDAQTRAWLAGLCAASAAVSVGSGLLLALEGTQAGDRLELHRWLGISAGSLLVLGALSLSSPRTRRFYFPLVVLAVGVILPAGHFGAGLTHGEGFLTAPFAAAPDASDTAPVDAPATEFAAHMAPIFNQFCTQCHGARRHKGKLSLHTHDAILAGSHGGPVVIPGDPANSEMLIRLRLPLDDEDHMPPPDKPQPSPEHIAALEAWIASGASFDAPALASLTPQAPNPAPASALAALHDAQVHVEVIDPQRGLLWIDFTAVRATDAAAAAALLEPLTDWIGDLGLADTAITDEIMSLVARMQRLRTLDVSGTRVSAEGLRAISTLPALETLRAARTSLGDAASDAIADLPALRKAVLWQSGLSPAAIDQLRSKRPELVLELGELAAPDAGLAEPPFTLSNDASAISPAASLEPINSVCPVSGRPVDPRFAVVHEGKVIGFCCEKCPGQFWEEPAKFPVAPKP